MKKIVNRITVTILLLVIQIVFFSYLYLNFLNVLPVAVVFNYILSALIVLHVVRKDDTSGYKIAWIVTIMMIPIVGGVIYVLFGTPIPMRKMHNSIFQEEEKNIPYLQRDRALEAKLEKEDERLYGTIKYIQSHSNYPIYKDTIVKYYPWGELMYADMLEEIKNAKKYIFMEYFIINETSRMWKEILSVLSAKVASGVDVRLIYDDVGSLDVFSLKELKVVREAGIKCIRFNPFTPVMAVAMNHRDHRKILVVDGHTAFNGGINIADEYINLDKRLGDWKDTGVKLKGKAVRSFTLMFLELWNAFCKKEEQIDDRKSYIDTGEIYNSEAIVMPYSDTPLDNEPIGENLYIEILNQAKNYVYIFSPYLIISDKMQYAMQMAKKRGVDVRIATPGIPDKKIIYRVTQSFYRDLVKLGIGIYEYTPGFLHGKSFVCDDKLAVVGSINLDYRSLYLHFECATFLYGAQEAILAVKNDALETMALSREITMEDCKRGFWGKIYDAILHLISPLL